MLMYFYRCRKHTKRHEKLCREICINKLDKCRKYAVKYKYEVQK